MTAGHIRPRGKAWEIRYPLPPCPDGKRRVETRTVHGSKRDAQRALREAMGAVDRGEHVEPSKAKVGEHVRSRVEQWRRAEQISPRTAERYSELLDLYIVPHLGNVALQKLTTSAVETWHTDLRTAGRKDGKGGLCARTVRHAHRLLVRAIGDAMRHNLVARNVAREQKPPATAESVEVETLAADQIAPMLAKLEGDPFYVPAVVALYVGLRRSEQLALKSSHVDLDGKVIRVREALEETVKGGIRIKQQRPKQAAGT